MREFFAYDCKGIQAYADIVMMHFKWEKYDTLKSINVTNLHVHYLLYMWIIPKYWLLLSYTMYSAFFLGRNIHQLLCVLILHCFSLVGLIEQLPNLCRFMQK